MIYWLFTTGIPENINPNPEKYKTELDRFYVLVVDEEVYSMSIEDISFVKSMSRSLISTCFFFAVEG